MKQKVTAAVVSQKEVAPAIFDMWIATELAKEALPGQFICVYPKNNKQDTILSTFCFYLLTNNQGIPLALTPYMNVDQ